MTDQPETMLEYQLRKIRRDLVWSVSMLGSILTLSTAAVIANMDVALSVLFTGAAIGLWFVAMAASGENICRRVFNRIPGSEISEIKRPDEGTTGGLTDD